MVRLQVMSCSRAVALGAWCAAVLLGCGKSALPGRWDHTPLKVGTTSLNVREVTVKSGEGGRVWTTIRGYYNGDGDELIPPRFERVAFMNDKVGFADENGVTHRIRFDVTGKKSAAIDALAYERVGPFDAWRMNDPARPARHVWYAIVAAPHQVQGKPVEDVVLLDELGDPIATIPDVFWPRDRGLGVQPRQQGRSLQFQVLPARGEPLHLFTDLEGRQTEPLIPKLERFRGSDPRVFAQRATDDASFQVLALPLGNGRFAPFALDGHIRRITEPGLLGYRPDKASAAMTLGYWWKDYERDGVRSTGWAHPDLAEESGPRWKTASIQLVRSGALVAQRTDGIWEFYAGGGSLLASGERTPEYSPAEFPWAKVKPQTFDTLADAMGAADVFLAREAAASRKVAEDAAAQREVERKRREGFVAALESGDVREACKQAQLASKQRMVEEIDLLLAKLGERRGGTTCGVDLATLANGVKDPRSRALVRELRQLEAKRDAEERAKRAEEARERQRQVALQQQAAAASAPAMNAGTWAPRGSNQSPVYDAEAQRAYTKALSDWTYGKTTWRPYKN